MNARENSIGSSARKASGRGSACHATRGGRSGGISDELARFEATLRSAQDQLSQADKDRRIASAKVEIFQGAVDLARGQLLPEPCRDALKLLVEHASDEWLGHDPTPDSAERREFAHQNVEAQLLATLLRPNLDR